MTKQILIAVAASIIAAVVVDQLKKQGVIQ